MKVVTVIGARPQFVKAAVVSRVLRNNGVEEKIIHTGQHFDENMSEIFFKEMEIPKPDVNLHIQSATHGAMTGRMLEGIEKELILEIPDVVLVYGDTNSTLAGALAAKKLHIPVAHVEAGLRSFNMKMPEEINRILTDRISDILFCPTDAAISNLRIEGFGNIPSKVIKCGDIMYDAALYYAERSEQNASFSHVSGHILVTMHRAENTDDPERLKSIISALNALSKDHKIIFPIHPRTRKIIDAQNIHLDFETVEPVGYLQMIQFLKNCELVMTDSGGLQKEAYFFNKFCVTLRDETEWTELVDNKVNFICGSDEDKIISTVKELVNRQYPQVGELYGTGNAGEVICQELLKSYGT